AEALEKFLGSTRGGRARPPIADCRLQIEDCRLTDRLLLQSAICNLQSAIGGTSLLPQGDRRPGGEQPAQPRQSPGKPARPRGTRHRTSAERAGVALARPSSSSSSY